MPTTNYIQTGHSFHSITNTPSLPDLQEALDYYATHLPSATELKENIPLFLDTNVLLRGYSVSPDKRATLYQFFEKHKSQIVITKQVDEEFTRNRAEIRETYAYSPEAQLTDLSDQLAGLLLELGDAAATEEAGEQNEAEETPDDLLTTYAEFQKIDNLSPEEKQFLIREFNELKTIFKASKNKPQNSNNAFPGMGDIIEKPAFPYGDYFLFHEMLKFVAEQKQDVVFLTFDVAKEDWLKKNKTPQDHYIYKIYTLHQKAIFILDANSFFENLYAESFEAIVPTEKKAARYVVKSLLEEELSILFSRLEKTIRRIAQKHNITITEDVSAKQILDELNNDGVISDAVYYELTGIWPVWEGLMEGEMELIRRRYTEEELKEVVEVVKENLRGIGRL